MVIIPRETTGTGRVHEAPRSLEEKLAQVRMDQAIRMNRVRAARAKLLAGTLDLAFKVEAAAVRMLERVR